MIMVSVIWRSTISSQSMAVEVNLEVVEVEEGMKGPTLCGTHGVESTSGRLSQNASSEATHIRSGHHPAPLT